MAELTELLQAQSSELEAHQANGGVAMESSIEQLRASLASQAGQAVESLRRELGADLADGLAEIRLSIKAVDTGDADRIQALAKAAAERDGELSDLYEFHAALDAGLVEVRAELLKVNSAIVRLADAQRLAAQVATPDHEADQPAAATAFHASTLGPLRSDVMVLQERVAAQSEALGALGRSVEGLRRKVPGPLPVATKTSPRPGR